MPSYTYHIFVYYRPLYEIQKKTHVKHIIYIYIYIFIIVIIIIIIIIINNEYSK